VLADEILNAGHDRELLKLMRDETTLVVLMVRIANQERQEEWREAHPEELWKGEQNENVHI
jgi:hypothetical protein